MDLNEVANLGEAVGGFAVVVSLLFLAWQLRTNTQTLKAQAAYEADCSFATLNEIIAANPSLGAISARATDPDAKVEDFDEAEWGQLFWLCRACFQKTQGQWWLKQSGMIPPAMWSNRLGWLRGFIELPVVRYIWQLELQQFNLVDEFVAEVQADTSQRGIGIVPPSKKGNADAGCNR